MELTDQQEEFSYAYIHAVATVAGYGIIPSPRVVDSRGIDLTISAVGDRQLQLEPSLHVQVKCTYQDIKKEQHLAYSLRTKDHHRLCKEVTTARILVVVLVPRDISDWMNHSEDSLILRHCGYWLSLRGKTPTTNDEAQMVHLPRTQLFDPPGLRSIMKQLDAGVYP